MNAAVRTMTKPDFLEPRGSEDELSELFRDMDAEGVYARTAIYEEVVERLTAFITRQREKRTEVFRFPPVMSRRHLEKAGYLKSFPNLLGCVCALHGTDADIHSAVRRFETGGEWTSSLTPADLVLTPAACYPVYPIAASAGPSRRAAISSMSPATASGTSPRRAIDRLQSFRMREYVCIGSPTRSPLSASVGSSAASRWRRSSRSLARSTRPAIPSSAAPAR